MAKSSASKQPKNKMGVNGSPLHHGDVTSDHKIDTKRLLSVKFDGLSAVPSDRCFACGFVQILKVHRIIYSL